MVRLLLCALLSLSLTAACLAQPAPDGTTPDWGQTFIPDYTFEGSDLDGWHVLGDADWQATEGELIGEASSDGGGWLVLDTSYQDAGVHALFQCTGACETGILFRMEPAGDGFTGTFLSLTDGDVAPYHVTLDARGTIVARERLPRAGGIWYRVAPPPVEEEEEPESDEEWRPPPRPEPPSDLPFHRPDTGLRPGDWNQIEVFLDVNVIRAFLNGGREIGGQVTGRGEGDTGLDGYGPIALFAGGEGTVRFNEVMVKDIALKVTPVEKASPRFRVHRLSDLYYSWGADAADFNRDGHMDVVAGPYIYFGPDYTVHREIYPAVAVGPSQEFSETHIQHTFDFNDDGWPDILRSAFGTTLFINPGGQSRRWDSYDVLPGVRQGEVTDFIDIDEDGVPELVYAGNRSVRYAKPNAADPTKPWKEYIVSEEGYGLSHGIGTGDINGDGRIDILNAYGWWDQPEDLSENKRWGYHPAVLGRFGKRATNGGGSLFGVYDINGDDLNDVLTTLNAHGFGLAWFEQQRDGEGKISFVRHMISDDYAAENAGGVTFSQPHGNTFADIDNDGIKDLIVGKRYWTHLDNYYDPDPYGPPVIYWYETVRDEDTPGGARFVPHLIHNRSGAGSEITAVDINDDGAVDIITSTNRGTFVFWNDPDYQGDD